MRKRFNIALLLDCKQITNFLKQKTDDIVKANGIYPHYCLGEHSVPHISIFQFEIGPSKQPQDTAQQHVLHALYEIQSHLNIVWRDFSQKHPGKLYCHIPQPCIDIRDDTTEAFQGIQWVELSISLQHNSQLHLLHKVIYDAMHHLHYQCLNAHLENYRPHITLMSFKKLAYNVNIPPQSIPNNIGHLFLKIPISLVIGEANENWELVSSTLEITGILKS